MPNTLSYVALAAALGLASPVLAQSHASGSAREAAPQAAPPASAMPAPAEAGSSRQAPTTTPESSAAPSTAMPPGANAPTGTNAAANVGASAEVASGMTVKDNTGASIGEVTEVKNGVATIRMGADTFTVESAKLGVSNGAATINATEAELKSMLPKK